MRTLCAREIAAKQITVPLTQRIFEAHLSDLAEAREQTKDPVQIKNLDGRISRMTRLFQRGQIKDPTPGNQIE